MEEPRIHPFASGTACVYSVPSPVEGSPNNEDAAAFFRVNGDTGVLIVADGVGGMPEGHRASRVAIAAVGAALEKAVRENVPLRDGILNGIEDANNRVLELGSGAATTLALAKIEDGTVRPFHVGDSMILLTGQRGKIKLQTIAHSPVGYAVESGILDEAEAVHHEERHVVSNIIGTPDMRIEIGPRIPLAPRDTLVLASDGLSDNFYVSEIVERVRAGSLATLARSLAADGRGRMLREEGASLPSKPDDLTFIVYRRHPPERGGGAAPRAERRRRAVNRTNG
jgi:serine/threonine protein phosphatase PrpC